MAAKMTTAPIRNTFLPFALPEFDNSELSYIREALDSGWVTTGPKTKAFEAQFAREVGAPLAVAVNSGTAAMHLALEAAGLQAGDEVITSAYTFAATAEVIRYFDARPVLVDISPRDFNLDPAHVASAISDRTRAIIPVHIGGLPAELDAISDIANRHGLAIIEDAAHAFPACYQERSIGSRPAGLQMTHAVCFSFYATKTITTGEGGMITTDDPGLADRCRVMALHGISKDAWKRYSAKGSWYYEISSPGFKYNMTDIAAAMGLAQLAKAERMRRRRFDIAKTYSNIFQQMPELQVPVDRGDCQHAWHLYMLRLQPDRLRIDRDEFIERLKEHNIGTSVHFIPLHLHPYYRQSYGYRANDFPVAYREYQREVSLPIYSRMTNEDVQDVIAAVSHIVGCSRR